MNVIVSQQAQRYLLEHIESGMKGNQKPLEYCGFFFSEIEQMWISFDINLNIGTHKNMPSLTQLGTQT